VTRSDDEELRAALRGRAHAAGLAPDERPVDTVIGSALDPEPLVVTGRRLVGARPAAVLRGLGAAALLGGARRLVLCVPDDLACEAAAALRRACAGTAVELTPMPARYPADAAALAHGVTGRAAAEDGPAPGVAVHDATALVHLDAASRGAAVTHAFVTVAGAVARPQVRAVRVGTTIDALVAAAGGATVPAWIALRGGALRGAPVEADEVLGPRDAAIIVLPHDHPVIRARRRPLGEEIRRALAACEGCAACTAHCPRALLGHRLAPHEVVRAVTYAHGDLGPALHAATLCTGCGACEVVCPTGLSPRALYAGVRAELARRAVPARLPETPAAAAPERDDRRLPWSRLVTWLALGDYVAAPPWEPAPL
jgi:Na+-translocating ferredoxin:NAD+ oxidoreductase RnfC subunit